MNYDTRLWNFVEDMNYDGSITISDVWLWFKWLYFYPGDYLIRLVINKTPELAHFLEISHESYGETLSGIISLIVWGIGILVTLGLIAFGEGL